MRFLRAVLNGLETVSLDAQYDFFIVIGRVGRGHADIVSRQQLGKQGNGIRIQALRLWVSTGAVVTLHGNYGPREREVV